MVVCRCRIPSQPYGAVTRECPRPPKSEIVFCILTDQITSGKVKEAQARPEHLPCAVSRNNVVLALQTDHGLPKLASWTSNLSWQGRLADWLTVTDIHCSSSVCSYIMMFYFQPAIRHLQSLLLDSYYLHDPGTEPGPALNLVARFETPKHASRLSPNQTAGTGSGQANGILIPVCLMSKQYHWRLA